MVSPPAGETMSSATDAFVEQNRARLLDELKSLVRIPSISTAPEHAGDVQRAAQFVADALRTAGMEHVEIIGQVPAGLCGLAARARQADRALLRPLRRPAR